jgi:hypothetical protein
MVVPLFAASVAILVLAVRSARLSVDEHGVSWGFGGLGIFVRRDRIVTCRVYADAVAVVQRRGFTWYLCARDYAPFTAVVAAVTRARLPATVENGPTPLRARLQSYGTAVDLLLVLDALGVTCAFLLL